MSNEQQLSLHGHGGNDGDSDILATKHFHRGDEESDEDNADINEIDKATIKMSRPRVTSATVSSGLIDRPLSVSIEGDYSNQGSCGSGFENKPGKRIPRAGHFEEKGFGRVRVEASLFEAEAKGPNVSYSTEVSLDKFKVMAGAELASASTKVGPVGVKVGVGFDTGVSAGEDGLEVKFLGTGFSVGSKKSVALLGSEASCSVM